MPDYAVRVTLELRRPMTDDERSSFHELLGTPTVLSVVPTEICVETVATAATMPDAMSLIDHLARSVAVEIGLPLGATLECEVVEWARHTACDER